MSFRREHDRQRPEYPDHEDQCRERDDHSRLEVVLVEADHDFPDHENQGRVGDECNFEPVHGEILDDAPEQFDHDEHRQDVGHHHVKGNCNGLAAENGAKIENDAGCPHKKGEDHDGNHQFDQGVDDRGEVSHVQIMPQVYYSTVTNTLRSCEDKGEKGTHRGHA